MSSGIGKDAILSDCALALVWVVVALKAPHPYAKTQQIDSR